MVLANFEHLKVAQILRANSLEFLVIIKEKVYPELVYIFSSNISFRENIIHSHVKKFDIDISLEGFARILQLSCKNVDIFNLLSFLTLSLLSLPPDYCTIMIIQAW